MFFLLDFDISKKRRLYKIVSYAVTKKFPNFSAGEFVTVDITFQND
jgi:hypothetical protein